MHHIFGWVSLRYAADRIIRVQLNLIQIANAAIGIIQDFDTAATNISQEVLLNFRLKQWDTQLIIVNSN